LKRQASARAIHSAIFATLIAALSALGNGAANGQPEHNYWGMGSLTERPQPNPLKNAYFGDLHVHTKTSVDSFLRRNMLTMKDAYEFAQGAKKTTAAGETIQLTRPLDFMALTDHSESYQTYDLCVEGTGPASRSPGCQAIKSDADMKANISLMTLRQLGDPRSLENCGGDLRNCSEATKRVWQYVQRLAAEYYHPGTFTSFIGYEYSAETAPGKPAVDANGDYNGHMHRNVIFANDHVPNTVFTALDGPRNYQLWDWLEKSCVGPCDVIAIPHNSNLSWGLAFALETVDGAKYTVDDWKRRARYERLAEIFQIKGNSECGVGFGTTDEECGFEQFLKPCTDARRTLCVRDTSFVRGALKEGLSMPDELGFNPFKLGIIASTDNHNALPGSTSRKAWAGSVGLLDGTPQARLKQINRNPGGLAAVWATENTRPAIFASLKNRETFGTSGTRIRVRFFGGWGFPSDMHERRDFVAMGYRLGVPMGGDLKAFPGHGAPTFSIWAGYDPESAKLRRIQIVKGWRADPGQTNEAIYDVSCSDGLTPNPSTHRCPTNGASVDLANCTPTPNKGAEELAATWTDPDFDPKRPAFYYVRVFENPTCRSSTYDALKLGRPIPPFPAPAEEERAWSSPIWYNSPGLDPS